MKIFLHLKKKKNKKCCQFLLFSNNYNCFLNNKKSLRLLKINKIINILNRTVVNRHLARMNPRENFLNDVHHGAILRRWILKRKYSNYIDYAAVELKVESRVKFIEIILFLYRIVFQLKEL